MSIALGGHHVDNPDDPVWTVPPALVDERVAESLDKPRREDLQVWAFLFALATGGHPPAHPVSVESGDDPPDKVIRCPSGTWGCELTELTVESLRADLAPVRGFGRRLKEALDADVSQYGHLRGRQVGAMFMPASMGEAGRPNEDDFNMLTAALREDKGYAGEGADYSQGLPSQLPDRGFYGQVGQFVVVVNAGGRPDAITVSAGISGSIARSQAVELLRDRVATKDSPGNDILLITCGLPDGKGYTCPLDGWLFQALLGELERGVELLDAAPRHLRGIALHDWRSGAWTQVFGRHGDTPWSS